jgi:hypothetical protein
MQGNEAALHWVTAVQHGHCHGVTQLDFID